MAKLLGIVCVALLIATLDGFPQKPPERPQVSSHPNQQNIKKQEQHRPLDRSQISTLPASINPRDGPQKNANRRARQVNEEDTPLDTSQISTLPAEIKFEETETRDKSEESSNRETRNADESGEDSRERKHLPTDIKIQPYRSSSEEKNSSEEQNRRG